MGITAVMIGNVFIKGFWIGATVYLVANGYEGWAVATLIGALLSGYGLSETKQAG